MAQFKTFVGRLETNPSGTGSARSRLCDDVECRNFKEARSKALSLFREKCAAADAPFALVLCPDHAAFIASGVRSDRVHHCGHGYCVDVTPSQGVAGSG